MKRHNKQNQSNLPSLVNKSDSLSKSEHDNNHPSTERKPRDFLLNYVVQIASLLIAIGAYSNDSIFVDMFKSKTSYSVVIATSFQLKSLFYTVQTNLSTSYLVRIPILLNVYIRNDSSVEQIIGAIEVEVQDENQNWIPMNYVNPDNGIFVAQYDDLKKSQLITFKAGTLKKNLARGVIKPKDIVSGWLPLEPPKNMALSDILKRPLRIIFHSGFGEIEKHELGMMEIGRKGSEIQQAELSKTNTIQDFSRLSVFRQDEVPVLP